MAFHRRLLRSAGRRRIAVSAPARRILSQSLPSVDRDRPRPGTPHDVPPAQAGAQPAPLELTRGRGYKKSLTRADVVELADTLS